MNASPLSPLAVENEPLLRRLKEDDLPATPAALAKELGRDKSNFSKTISRLRDEGLISADGLTVTDRADLALRAMDVGAGRLSLDGAAGERQGREIEVLHAYLTPHPDNPRHAIDEEELLVLMGAIDAVGRVKDALIVTPPSVGGHRFILAGQRRWLAVGRLIEDGRYDPDMPMPAVEEAPADAEEVILIGLLENSGAPMSELDEARAFKRLCDAKHWTAAECARQSGRLAKTVQDRLKVLNRASPEDLAALESGEKNYREVRDNVTESRPKPALDLSPKLAVLVAEIADAAQYRTGDVNGFIAVKPGEGGALSTLRERQMIDTRSGRDGALSVSLRANQDLTVWFVQIGFVDERADCLYRLRDAVAGPLTAGALARDGRYLTDWLNTAATETPLTPANPVRGVAAPETPTAQSPQAEPVGAHGDTPNLPRIDIPILSNPQMLVMAEVCHKLAEKGFSARGGVWAAKVDGMPSSAAASALIRNLKLLGLMQPSGADWAVYLTDVGEGWLKQAREDGDLPHPINLAEFHGAWSAKVAGSGPYATAWLNAPVKAIPGLTGDAFSQQLREVREEMEAEEGGEGHEVEALPAAPGEPARGKNVFGLDAPELGILDALFQHWITRLDMKRAAEVSGRSLDAVEALVARIRAYPFKD